MKKRNLLISILSLALVCIIGVGATLAYFTDKTETKTNTFTTGNVGISLIDETNPEDGEIAGVPGENGIAYDDVMPGDVLSKIVGVNTDADSADAYVAVRVAVTDVVAPNAVSIKNEEIAAQISDIIASRVDADLWASKDMGNGDVVYYFKSVVPADTKNLVLFNNIPIPGSEWNNEYAELSFNVRVQAAAIQADNTDLDLFMGMDWENLTNEDSANPEF